MSNYTITIVGDTIEEMQERIIALLPAHLTSPLTPHGVKVGLTDMPFQDVMVLVGERVENEGYDMEVWKKGSRPEPELPPSEKKKEEARAKLRGDLVASLAEATHATAAVKEEVTKEFIPDVGPTAPLKKQPAKKAKTNGKPESDEDRKLRIINQLQEMYTAGRKADVNKLLSEYGDGTRTFSAIPAEKFVAIEAALETL